MIYPFRQRVKIGQKCLGDKKRFRTLSAEAFFENRIRHLAEKVLAKADFGLVIPE
jgi:hypothetical protein